MTTPRYVMATTAHHKLGDISRDEPDLAYITSEDGDNWVGAFVAGFGFTEVRFPKASTRDLSDEERARYEGAQLTLNDRPVGQLHLDEGAPAGPSLDRNPVEAAIYDGIPPTGSAD